MAQEVLTVPYVVQGHFEMQTEGAGSRHTALLISGQPAQLPVTATP